MVAVVRAAEGCEVPLTAAEQRLAAARIMAAGGTIPLICARLHVSVRQAAELLGPATSPGALKAS